VQIYEYQLCMAKQSSHMMRQNAGNCNMYGASERAEMQTRLLSASILFVLASLFMVFYCRRQISPLRSCDSIPVLPNNHCDYHPLFIPLISKLLYFLGTRFKLGLVEFPTGERNLSVPHRVQNGSGAHVASYSMGAGGSFS
jgi:hypothetical protein